MERNCPSLSVDAAVDVIRRSEAFPAKEVVKGEEFAWISGCRAAISRFLDDESISVDFFRLIDGEAWELIGRSKNGTLAITNYRVLLLFRSEIVVNVSWDWEVGGNRAGWRGGEMLIM